MQGSELFNQIIASHLQSLADKDPLFAETFKKPKKNIEDCVSYILDTVKKSGKNGLANEEVYAMAIHYYDEDDLKAVGKVKCKVVVTKDKDVIQSPTNSPYPSLSAKPKVTKKQQIVNQPSLF